MDLIRTAARGIPTARSVEHLAFTVPDLPEAISFFVDVIGAELLYELGPFSDDGDWMEVQIGVHARATCTVAHLRLGPNVNLELFSWNAPDQNAVPPKPSDIGAGHIAFFVDDMEQAAEYVRRQPGVTVRGEVQTITDGPSAGYRWLVFTTPWGLDLELVNRPEHLPYEQAVSGRFYGPAPSWSGARDGGSDGGGPAGA